MVSKQATTLIVGLGEVKVSNDPSVVLTCLGLGSCIGIAAYDPLAHIGGMAHIVLPHSNNGNGQGSSKYADIGIPSLFEQVEKAGGKRSRLIIKIAGGAQISKARGLEDSFQIGKKNSQAVLEIMSTMGLSIKASDVGGNHGRTLKMYLESGNTIVNSAMQGTKEI